MEVVGSDQSLKLAIDLIRPGWNYFIGWGAHCKKFFIFSG